MCGTLRPMIASLISTSPQLRIPEALPFDGFFLSTVRFADHKWGTRFAHAF